MKYSDHKLLQSHEVNLWFSYFFLFNLCCEACESNGTTQAEESITTKRPRFTRRSTTPTTLKTSITTRNETTVGDNAATTKIVSSNASSTVSPSNETIEFVETSIVTGSPSIAIEISTKKSLRVRNCGERIGDDIPFVAVLVHTNPFEKKSSSRKKKRSLSKGVLISENFVLATVSSIYHSESFWTVSSVRLGDFVTWNKYASRDKSQSIEVDVEEIFYHKKKDLALIKLKESVNFTEIIRPACLPSSDSYNFQELQSHLCKRSHHHKGPADVTLEFAVIYHRLSTLTTYQAAASSCFSCLGAAISIWLQTILLTQAHGHFTTWVLRVGWKWRRLHGRYWQPIVHYT